MSTRRRRDELRGRLKWFLFGRVAVISCFLAMVAVVLSAHARASASTSRSASCCCIVAADLRLLSVCRRCCCRTRAGRPRSRTCRSAFDVLLVTGVILLTGGVDSPFAVPLQPADHQRRRAAVRRAARSSRAVARRSRYDGMLRRAGRQLAVGLAQPDAVRPAHRHARASPPTSPSA